MGDGVDLTEEVFKPSIDTAIRLCRYARETLRLDADAFPIAALPAAAPQIPAQRRARVGR